MSLFWYSYAAGRVTVTPARFSALCSTRAAPSSGSRRPFPRAPRASQRASRAAADAKFITCAPGSARQPSFSSAARLGAEFCQVRSAVVYPRGRHRGASGRAPEAAERAPAAPVVLAEAVWGWVLDGGARRRLGADPHLRPGVIYAMGGNLLAAERRSALQLRVFSANAAAVLCGAAGQALGSILLRGDLVDAGEVPADGKKWVGEPLGVKTIEAEPASLTKAAAGLGYWRLQCCSPCLRSRNTLRPRQAPLLQNRPQMCVQFAVH